MRYQALNTAIRHHPIACFAISVFMGCGLVLLLAMLILL